ncbi:hypothetical protein [Actinomadura parmotrematis]|uniref:DUF2029 domain-containing protein n=1 Tax=Actinomadura parmotrematis TaxID=2864039 RepID=A0ABS7G3E2_9ACTN|nr:hypothetical protein [Actinomadura parmotrematis]MBW8486880.1 hypothetical protein [Actinomadura parmotrematis]
MAATMRAAALWAAFIAAVFAIGTRAAHTQGDLLPPLHASARLLTWQMLPAVAYAALAVAVLPPLARRMAWRPLLLAAWAAAAGWAIVLALSDGWDALHRPLDAPTEYPVAIPAVDADPALWLRTFTERLAGYTTHVRGHPPLPTLLVWTLDAAGLHGTGWAAALIIAAGSSAAAAVAVTVRAVAGERIARAAVPFLALAPLAVWVATTMDALFLGVAAWGTALLARRRALAGGLVLGALPYLSYGLLPLFAVPAVVVLLQRPRWWPMLAGLAVVPAAFTLGGFWWPDGVAATHATYLISGGSAQRSYAFYLVGNLAVLALLTGPAVAAAGPAAARALRRRMPPEAPVALLAAAALVGVLALDLSGVTRGEVERIWVPFAAWLLPLAALTPSRIGTRPWLAAQAATAIALQALVHSHW